MCVPSLISGNGPGGTSPVLTSASSTGWGSTYTLKCWLDLRVLASNSLFQCSHSLDCRTKVAVHARRAIAAAEKAAPAMAAMGTYQRKEVLEHCVREFERRFEDLAVSLCIEAGKPIKVAALLTHLTLLLLSDSCLQGGSCDRCMRLTALSESTKQCSACLPHCCSRKQAQSRLCSVL